MLLTYNYKFKSIDYLKKNIDKSDTDPQVCSYLVNDMNAEEEGVVHDLEGLQGPTVPLYRVHQGAVDLRLEEDPVWIHLHEIQVLIFK